MVRNRLFYLGNTVHNIPSREIVFIFIVFPFSIWIIIKLCHFYYILMLVTLAINVHIFDAKLKKVMLCYIKIFKYLPFAEE